MANFPRIIEASDVSLNLILEILTIVGFNASIFEGREIWIRHDGFLPLKIQIDETNKVFFLESSCGINESFSMLDRLKLANEFNASPQIRFYIPIGGVLVGAYSFPYYYGLIPNQMLDICKSFEIVFITMLRKAYKKGGVLDF